MIEIGVSGVSFFAKKYCTNTAKNLYMLKQQRLYIQGYSLPHTADGFYSGVWSFILKTPWEHQEQKVFCSPIISHGTL